MDLNDIFMHSKQTYDNIADIYYEQFHDEVSKKEFDRNLLLSSIKELNIEGGLILDIGCGSSGHIGKFISDQGFNVCGIDLSPKSIELAKKTNPHMQFEEMNMLDLNFNNSSIQAIYAFYSIIHIPKVRLNDLFTEFHRVLKHNGLLVLAVHEGVTEEVIKEMLGHEATLFVAFFAIEELIDHLKANSFVIDYYQIRNPYEFEHQTKRIYIIAKALK